MTKRLFSTARRPVHLGPYPLETLRRGTMPDVGRIAPDAELSFARGDAPESIVNAMGEYQAMMDAIRDVGAEVPDCEHSDEDSGVLSADSLSS